MQWNRAMYYWREALGHYKLALNYLWSDPAMSRAHLAIFRLRLSKGVRALFG